MRFSADENDPGYLPWRELGKRGREIEVYLDGDLIDDVRTADDIEGIVIVPAKDEEGHIITRRTSNEPGEERDEVVEKVLRGNVRIVVPT